MENMTTENFIIVGQAIVKMVGFFWPVILGTLITWGVAEHVYNREAK